MVERGESSPERREEGSGNDCGSPSIPRRGSFPGPGADRRLAAAVVASLLGLYGLYLLDHDLWSPDEPRVAAVAREALEGAWVAPTLNGRPFLEQPPLHAWCVALAYAALGFEPAGVGRLPSALFGLGGLVLVYLLASHLARVGGHPASARRLGLLAAFALGISEEYFTTAHRVVVDGALTFFTTASAYAMVRALTSPRPRPPAGWLAASYALASLAFLSKGVLGLAFPALATFAIAFAISKPRILLAAKLWLAPIIFAAITGPWFFLLSREKGADGLVEVVWVNTIARSLPVAGAFQTHVKPFYYYLASTPAVFLPSTIFLAGAIFERFRRGRARAIPAGALESPRTPPAARVPGNLVLDFGLLWFAACFVLLSIARTKRAIYMVPAFPAAALASGVWLESFLRGETERRYSRLVEVALWVSPAALGIAIAVAAFILPGASLVPAIVAPVSGLVFLAAARRPLREGARREFLELWILFGLLLALAAKLALVPALDRKESMGGAARAIARTVPLGSEVYLFTPTEVTEGLLPFYAGRRATVLRSLEELEAELARGREVHLVTIDRSPDPNPPGPLGTTQRIQYPRIRHFPHEVLWEDLTRDGAAFRLSLLRGGPPPEDVLPQSTPSQAPPSQGTPPR